MIEDIRHWVNEGHKHGIPTCCGVRFGLTRVTNIRYRIDRRLQNTRWHGMADRIQTLTPRHAFAVFFGQGYVPCEYHLVRWLLTGKRPYILQDDLGE